MINFHYHTVKIIMEITTTTIIKKNTQQKSTTFFLLEFKKPGAEVLNRKQNRTITVNLMILTMNFFLTKNILQFAGKKTIVICL